MGNPTLCVLDFATGQKEFVPISDCVHTSMNEPAPLAAFNVTDLDENVLEACPGCSVIRLCNLSSGTVHRVCENIQARDLCMGPNDTILVVLPSGRALQLVSGVRGVSPIQFDAVLCRLQAGGGKIVGIQYSRHSDTAVMVSTNPPTISGHKFNVGGTVCSLWKHEMTICGIPLDPTSISSTPNRDILVLVNTNEIICLKSSNGTIITRMPLVGKIQWATFDGKETVIAKLGNGKFIKYQDN